jgi:hypothetical protein
MAMKEIHRQSLLANPVLISLVKPKRSVSLREIFRGGFERFKVGEIDRQVRETDRLTTKDKARFFQRRLKLPWGSTTNKESDVVKRIDNLIRLRHQLVHFDYSTHVSDQDIKDSRQLLLEVQYTCFSGAEKIYATHFGIK